MDAAISSARNTIGKPQRAQTPQPQPKRASLLDIVAKPRRSAPTISAPAPTPGWLASNAESDSAAPPLERGFAKSSVVKPIWRVVLDEDRDIVRQEREEELILAGGEAEELWPPIIPASAQMTFELWERVEENRQVTTALESVIERPGQHLNPVHISGEMDIGKSHLVTACAQAMQLQLGVSSVRLIRCGLLVRQTGAWPIPPQEIAAMRMLIVEDLDQIVARMGRLQELASWLLWQVSSGVQVVFTSDGTLNTEETSGDLRRLLDSSVGFHLPPYSNVSLMRMLRRRCGRRDTILSDDHLRKLIEVEGGSVPRLFAAFEKFSLASADGSLPSDPAQAIDILSGAGTAYQAIFSDDDPADLAREIAESVIVETEHTEFELEPPEMVIEPEWDPGEVEDVDLSMSHAARMEEEDAMLREAWSEGFDLPEPVKPTADLLTELSSDSLERMVDVGVAFEGYDKLITRLESEMKVIADELENADSEQLLQLADRLVELEESIKVVRPQRSDFRPHPLTAVAEPEAALPDLEKTTQLDEYTPEGEWNIDEDEVSVDDLFGMAELQPVSINVLIPARSIPKDDVEIGDEEEIEVSPADPRRQRDDEGNLEFMMPDMMERQVGATRHKRERASERKEQERKQAMRAKHWRASVEAEPEQKPKPTRPSRAVRQLKKAKLGVQTEDAARVTKMPILEANTEAEEKPETTVSADDLMAKVTKLPKFEIDDEPDEESQPQVDEDDLMARVTNTVVLEPIAQTEKQSEQPIGEDAMLDRVVKKIIRQPIEPADED